MDVIFLILALGNALYWLFKHGSWEYQIYDKANGAWAFFWFFMWLIFK